MKKHKKCYAFACIMLSLFSCSQEEDIDKRIGGNDKDNFVGRFDNSPFVWDEVYSLRPSSQTFIGDFSVDRLYNVSTNTKIGSGNSGATESSTSSGYNNNNTEITNPNGIYVGVAYPSSSFGTSFDKEITEPRNPIDIVFDFKDPYIDEIQKETGSIGYTLASNRAIKSEEYQNHLKANKPSVEYSMTSYSSYKDIQKAISGSVKFGSIFSAKVQANASSHKLKIQGRMVARMTAVNFNVYMDTPIRSKGFFKDAELNNNSSSVYMKSLTYGKIVYMAIESSYDYTEIKKAFQASFSSGFTSAAIKGNETITKIFNSSIVTIFVLDDIRNGYSFYDLDKIGELNNILFSSKFDTYSYGFPIFCEGRYVNDNSIFHGSSYTRPNNPNRQRCGSSQ